MVAAKMKVLFQEALNCGIKIDTVQTMWNEVVTVEDDTVLETDGSDNEEEEKLKMRKEEGKLKVRQRKKMTTLTGQTEVRQGTKLWLSKLI
jgi:hypothetical protein